MVLELFVAVFCFLLDECAWFSDLWLLRYEAELYWDCSLLSFASCWMNVPGFLCLIVGLSIIKYDCFGNVFFVHEFIVHILCK
jgi:hypothetical protein